MHKFIFPLFFFLVFSGAAQTFTKIANPSACKAKINKKTAETKSIIANFEELVHSSMFNTPKKAQGKLAYKQSDKIRWEHTSPKKQIILINGTKARFQENGQEVKNATANRVVKKIQGLMVQLFSGDFLNEKEFNIAYFESGSHYKLVLKPKNARMANYIASIDLLFSKSTLNLDQMTLVETENDKIVYAFSNIRTNTTITDTQFTKFQ